MICCVDCLFRRYIREVCVVFRGPAIEKLQDSSGFMQYCSEARAFRLSSSVILQGDDLDRQIPVLSGCRQCKRAEATVNTEDRLCSSLLGRVSTQVEHQFKRGLRYFPHARMAERVGFICEQGGHKCSLVQVAAFPAIFDAWIWALRPRLMQGKVLFVLKAFLAVILRKTTLSRSHCNMKYKWCQASTFLRVRSV